MDDRASLQRERAHHDDGGDWDVWAAHEARRIAADRAALLDAARAMFRQWAEDGLLDRYQAQYEYDAAKRHYVRLPPKRLTEEEAVEHWAACVADTLSDALSTEAHDFLEHVSP